MRWCCTRAAIMLRELVVMAHELMTYDFRCADSTRRATPDHDGEALLEKLQESLPAAAGTGGAARRVALMRVSRWLPGPG